MESLWLAYVDDNITAGPNLDDVMLELQTHLDIESGTPLDVGDSVKYVGVQ